jgi:alcohol dehydrogenase
MGAFAEYAAVPEHVVAKIPPLLDFEAAASVPLAGLTALQALRDELKVGTGDKVLITGGAGGVGTFAIQIAKWLGAHVITTASPRGKDLVERLGADEVINYTEGQIADHVRDVDGVFDLVGGEALNQSFGVVKRGGTVVTVVATPEPETARKDLGRGKLLQALFWLASFTLRAKAKRNGARYRFLFMHPSAAELSELASLIEAGTLTPVIDHVFQFAEIEKAFRYLEEGRAKGKVVVTMRPESTINNGSCGVGSGRSAIGTRI